MDYFVSKASSEHSVKFITYGCQMNVNDVELVRSLLLSSGYVETDDVI
ncbi:unnamed protein product [Brugia timori]|uniref:MTTase N-terminal domain-containing protein n=1 Tax=Brugia timori TaxID=42155 RepID=A0A3P7SZ28_9BILA|nr:unnamed protein product [Brugia timori]